MRKLRTAVIGCGGFGQNHLRVVGQSPESELVAAVDADIERAHQAATPHGVAFTSAEWRDVVGRADAAIIATPTSTHADIGVPLLEAGLDVLVEKPISGTLESAQRLIDAARQNNRILQVGHLERYNPAVVALTSVVSLPLFFEIHRLNQFAARSLDVDVVLDLMIHDIDLVLALTGQTPEEVRAAGIRILSDKVDIANARLAFSNGCVANLTASRVSTERVRKLRLFQPQQYISIDYGRQDGIIFTVDAGQQIRFEPLTVVREEPLAAQWRAFVGSAASRSEPAVSGISARQALAVSLDILGKIEEHAGSVRQTLREYAGRD
jgi:predicted dehydrogenase